MESLVLIAVALFSGLLMTRLFVKFHLPDVTAYLVANGVRIQEAILSQENDWKHTWVNLPSVDRNGIEVIYTVHESMFPGYVSSVTKGAAAPGGTTGGSVADADGFEDGGVYLLHTKYGYIGAADNRLVLQTDPDTALNDNSYLWTAAVHSDGRITLTNKIGQTMYWDNYMLRAAAQPGSNKNLYYTGGTLQHYISDWNQWQYPRDSTDVPGNVTWNYGIYTNNSGTALAITPQTVVMAQPPPVEEDDGNNFVITNTPVGDAVVSLRVNKEWDLGGLGAPLDYEESSVRMDLLANGVDAGLSGVLNLRNGWSYTFSDLPMFDSRGHEITYSIREAEVDAKWRVDYGPVTSVNGSRTELEMTVTNVYRATVMLPSTGGIGPYGHIAAGLLIMVGSLIWYCGQRRKYERRVR